MDKTITEKQSCCCVVINVTNIGVITEVSKTDNSSVPQSTIICIVVLLCRISTLQLNTCFRNFHFPQNIWILTKTIYMVW